MQSAVCVTVVVTQVQVNILQINQLKTIINMQVICHITYYIVTNPLQTQGDFFPFYFFIWRAKRDWCVKNCELHTFLSVFVYSAIAIGYHCSVTQV